MKLDQRQARAIARHVGYGKPTARLWFVGTEEGLGGAASDEENTENLLARSKWSPVMDMFEAHQSLRERGEFIDISQPRAGHVGVWQWMSKIARAFEGHDDFSDTSKANDFIRRKGGLGRKDGNSFLTELSPFPSRTADRPEGLRHFSASELAALLKERRERQLEFLYKGPAKCVICYGTSRRSDFARHFGVSWEPLPAFKWVSSKGLRRETTVYRSEVRNGPRAVAQLFMLPFLGQGAINHDVLRQFTSSADFTTFASR